MDRRRSERGGHWAVVLAGGEGERLRPLVQRWLGRHRPKQYCAFTGTRSMFQHTVDRALALVPAQQVVVVAATTHQVELTQQLAGRHIGAVLLQPDNRDTAAGIFLPLAHIRAHDPDATVLVLPSDHFIYPEDRFCQAVREMTDTTERFPERMLLLAVRPDRPEVEYGWVEPGGLLGGSPDRPVRGISRFLEKPPESQASAAMVRGALWNTLVMTAKLGTLWSLGWRCFPDMMPLFEDVERRVRNRVDPRLAEIYARMPRRNFSSGLLARAPESVAVVEADGFLWSDWGRPERILDTLGEIGKPPAFPPELVGAARSVLELPAPDPSRALQVSVLKPRKADTGFVPRRAV